MHPLLENLVERPLSHKLAAWFGTILLTLFVFWQFFYSVVSTEKEKLDDSIVTLETNITQEQRLARDLGKFRKEVKDLEIKLKFALQELPNKREIPDLLTSIEGLAKNSGLEIQLFKPAPENYREFYAEVPVAISVDGTFHQVSSFFDQVGRLSRIVNINQIGVREPKVGEVSVKVKTECVATTFRYLEENERAAKEVAKPDKGKRRH